MNRHHLRRGLARTDVLVMMVCACVVLSLAAVVLQDERARRLHPKSIKDATQLAQFHKAIIVFSRQFNGLYATPGLIDTLPVDGQDIPGQGGEDVAQNTTANLYSSMIAQNYFTPGLVISPVEKNPLVEAKKDYDQDAYDPLNDSYWDATFVADLHERSNASFAHLPMYGERREQEWRETLNSEFPILSNRGPVRGSVHPGSHTTSPHGHWSGNVCYNDGHVVFEESVRPEGVTFLRDEEPQPDNIFAFDDGKAGADAICTFTATISEDDLDVQFD